MSNLTPEQEESLERLLKNPARVNRLIIMADEDEKREWLFVVIRKTAAWIAGFLGAIIVFWDSLVRILKGIIE